MTSRYRLKGRTVVLLLILLTGLAIAGGLVAMETGIADKLVKGIKEMFGPTPSPTPTSIQDPLKAEFANYAEKHGFNKQIAAIFWDRYPVVKEVYLNNSSDSLPMLTVFSKNQSFFDKIYKQIQRDDYVYRPGKPKPTEWIIVPYKADKLSWLVNVMKNAAALELYGLNRIDSIWLLNNATRFGFRDLTGLKRALEFSESNNISLNFPEGSGGDFTYLDLSGRICHSALADLGYYFHELYKYPYEAKYCAEQVGDVIYFFNLHEVKGKDYVWNKVIIPFVKWRYDKLESGEFDSLDYKITKGELKKLAEKKHPLVVDAAARSLYPFDVIVDTDLLGFTDVNALQHDASLALKRGVANMQYNESIGDSPFEYIYKLLISDMEKKNWRYKEAFRGSKYQVPSKCWPNSWEIWKAEIDKYINSSPKIAIIKGYKMGMGWVGIPVNPNFSLAGQDSPYYAKVIGAMLNKPVVVLCAPYTTDATGVHDEPFVVDGNGDLIGFWYSRQAFLDDYDPAKNPGFYNPYEDRSWSVDDFWKQHKPWIELEIIYDYVGRRFGYEDLPKVLNP